MSSQTENSNSTQIFQPEGIIVDNNDNLYVNDIQSNEIKKYDINGNFILKWGHQTVNGIPLNHPHSNEIDKQGNIYITDQNNKRVVKFSPNGTFITAWGENGNNGANFLHPHGIALDFQNNVFVSDRDLDTIQKFSPNGTFIASWGSEVQRMVSLKCLGMLRLIVEIMFLYLIMGIIEFKFSPTTVHYLRDWGTEGKGAGEFNHPAVIAFDNAENLYVTDSENQ